MAFALLCYLSHAFIAKDVHDERLFFTGGRMLASSSVFGQVENYLKNKKFNSALMQLGGMSVKYSKDVGYLTYLSQTLRGLGDQDALIKTLKELHRQQPNETVEVEIMELLYKNAHINEALDIALGLQEKPMSIADKQTVYLTLLRIYIEENDFEGVQEVLNQSTVMLTGNDFASWAQGLVYLSNGEKNLAVAQFRKAVQLNPANDQAWVSLAVVHQEMGDDELALANLEKALDCNPMNNSAVKLYSQWGSKRIDKTAKALQSVRFYLTEHGFDEEISVCHVQLLCHLKFWSEATSEMNKLIIANPRNLNYVAMKKNLEQNINM
jgi:tetratricopeptide (TPR) repeat protein